MLASYNERECEKDKIVFVTTTYWEELRTGHQGLIRMSKHCLEYDIDRGLN